MVTTNTVSPTGEMADWETYGHILLNSGASYTVIPPFLVSGELPIQPQIAIHISVFAEDTVIMLRHAAPLLKAYNTPFKVLQNAYLIDQCNGLVFGKQNAGKILTFYPPDEKTAKVLVGHIERATKLLKGLVIDDCTRLGQVLYYPWTAPKISFKIPDEYRIKRTPKLIGGYYLPLRLLRSNPKGDIFLGANLRKFSLTKCLIKQARDSSYTDPTGRKATHRLFWQKAVIEDLQHDIPMPKLIDFCNNEDDFYLVTEFIEGVSLATRVHELRENLRWYEMQSVQKKELIDYFLHTVMIVNNIHSCGYIHRDIQIENFIVSDDRRMYIIDFELAYNYQKKVPQPAFTLGTQGFVSPEQERGETPAITEDIFSLGAVLTYFILNPMSESEFSDNIYNRLVEAGTEQSLLDIIVHCLSENPDERPSLVQVIEQLKNIITLL